MEMLFRRAALTCGFRSVMLAATGLAAVGQASAQAPSSTANFKVGTTPDANGRIPVVADWTTPLSMVQAGGDNLLANATAVNVRIGADANLFSITDLQTGPPGVSRGPLMTLAPNSVVTNYGVLESYPQGYPSFNIPNQNNRSASIIQMADNTVVNNYGVMGFMPEEADDNYGGVAVPCVSNGLVCTTTGAILNNYGLIVGDTPATTNDLPGDRTVVNNYAGAKMIAGGGSPILGATSFNYQDGGLIDLKNDGSYCAHTGSYSNASNWGYCLGIAVGYWMDQGRGQNVADYGGPLVPSSIDMDGNIVFNGTISSTYFEDPGQASRQCPATYSAFELAPIHIVGNVTASLSSTLYQVGATKAIVNYLPLTYGNPLYSEPWNAVGQHTGPLSSTLNFNFAGLTTAQQQMIQAAVAGGSSSKPGSFTVDGQTYAWCPFMKVNVAFSNTIAGTGVNGFPVPGVSFAGPGGKPAYYTDTGNLTTNPYYLTNAATVRLLGNLPLNPGRTVIAPGWTLVVGAQLSTVVNNAVVTTNYDNPFSVSAGAGDSILIEAATAHTNGNINNVIGQTRVLSGALIIDNPTQPVTLPNLAGGGSLMLEGGNYDHLHHGTASTTLAGSRNTLVGPIYLADGDLKIAPGAVFMTPPRLIIGVNDWRQTFPIFDLSELAPGQTFTLSALRTAGPQIQTGQVGKPVWFPTINLGAATLVIGTGKADSSKFIGGLIGSGSLVVAPGTFLDLGGVSAYDFNGNTAVPISTYSGGTQISEGATLMLENLLAVGSGAVNNAGTLRLGSSEQYLLQQSGVTSPPAAANPLHVMNLPAAYTQTATGNLDLRVNGGDTPGQAGSGAGSNYEVLDAAGPVSLSGALNLHLITGYVPPRGGATFTVVRAPAGVSGAFTHINITGSTGSFITQQQVTPTTVTVTVTEG